MLWFTTSPVYVPVRVHYFPCMSPVVVHCVTCVGTCQGSLLPLYVTCSGSLRHLCMYLSGFFTSPVYHLLRLTVSSVLAFLEKVSVRIPGTWSKAPWPQAVLAWKCRKHQVFCGFGLSEREPRHCITGYSPEESNFPGYQRGRDRVNLPHPHACMWWAGWLSYRQAYSQAQRVILIRTGGAQRGRQKKLSQEDWAAKRKRRS